MKTAGKNLNQDRSAGPGAVGQGLRPQPDGFYGAGRGAGRQRAGSAGGQSGRYRKRCADHRACSRRAGEHHAGEPGANDPATGNPRHGPVRLGHVPARRRGGESGNDRPGAGLDRDWTILFSKGSELLRAKRRLRREQLALAEARSLDEASELAQNFGPESVSAVLLNDAQNELELSAESNDNNGIKERTGFRLERRVAAYSRNMGRGNGFLATIGAISPFVGLFGTVWGIMNSFIGIAHSQTTNLAVVAPGIAEALLATALGTVAAIPAVVIYNIFARVISGHRANWAT